MRDVISVSIPKETVEKLNSFAKKSGRSRSDIIRESINLYLWERQLNRLKKEFKPFAKKAGILTEEDVFKQIS